MHPPEYPVLLYTRTHGLVNRLAKRYNPTDADNTPLHQLVYAGNAEAVRAYLARDTASLNAYNSADWTPLHVAATLSSADVFRTLHRSGARVDADTRYYRYQPLHVAAHYGNFEVCRYLVREGNVPVDTPACEGGKTALIVATRKNRLQLVEWLLAKGSDVNYRMICGRTALHHSRTAHMVCVLVKAGATPHVKTRGNRDTPLHSAARANNLKVCKALIHYGARDDWCNAEGCTPFELAVQSGHTEVCSLFLQRGVVVRPHSLRHVDPAIRPDVGDGVTGGALDAMLELHGSVTVVFPSDATNLQQRRQIHARAQPVDRIPPPNRIAPPDPIATSTPSALRRMLYNGWKVSQGQVVTARTKLLAELVEDRANAIIARGLCQRFPLAAVQAMFAYVNGATSARVNDWLGDNRVTVPVTTGQCAHRTFVCPLHAAVSITPRVRWAYLSPTSRVRLRHDVLQMYCTAQQRNNEHTPMLILQFCTPSLLAQYCLFVWHAYKCE